MGKMPRLEEERIQISEEMFTIGKVKVNLSL
jgi:hypothetical protein